MTHPFALPDADPDRAAELGRLAGALVHELKNPLGVILMNCEMLQQDPKVDARSAKRLARIHDSARSLQEIIQGFLAYARPGRPDPDAIDVNALLEKLLDQQQDALARDLVTPVFKPDADLCLLAADPQHLRSVFGNVLTNAREALLERSGERKLLVFTRHAPGAVRIVIANNGPPLPESVAAHLFEPFHSTKEHGTGLGLAIVRRLVELHHGTVSVRSDPDQGVSFTFEFPTTLGPARQRTALAIPLAEAEVVASTAAQPAQRRRRKPETRNPKP